MIGWSCSCLVEESGVKRLGILRAELEDVADFDGVPHGQLAAAARAGVAVRRVAQVGELRRLEIAAEVHAREVRIGLVGAGDAVDDALDLAVGVDRNRLLQSDRPGEADRRAGHLLNDGRIGQFDLAAPIARRILPSLASWSPRTSTAIGLPSAMIDQAS